MRKDPPTGKRAAVVGAGPAGLTAGLYAGRSRMKALIVEKGQDGGQIATTSEIENYPGQIVDEEESGPSLIARMTKQAEKFGCERVSDASQSVELAGTLIFMSLLIILLYKSVCSLIGDRADRTGSERLSFSEYDFGVFVSLLIGRAV